MVALRDFVDGLNAADLKPYYANLRTGYLENHRDVLHRVLGMELPRLGIAPGRGVLTEAEDAAVGNLVQTVAP